MVCMHSVHARMLVNEQKLVAIIMLAFILTPAALVYLKRCGADFNKICTTH